MRKKNLERKIIKNQKTGDLKEGMSLEKKRTMGKVQHTRLFPNT